jgi:hypothetical protein
MVKSILLRFDDSKKDKIEKLKEKVKVQLNRPSLSWDDFFWELVERENKKEANIHG